MTETWKPVVGYVGIYEVSDQGRVRSLPRRHAYKDTFRSVRGRVLRINFDTKGYRIVHLYNGGHDTRKAARVCCLVAEAFIGPRPLNDQVCHRDGVRTNDALSNLRYDTCAGNHADKRRHGTHREGEKIHFAKLKDHEVRTIKSLLHKKSKAVLARQFGVSRPTISYIALGKTWKHI